MDRTEPLKRERYSYKDVDGTQKSKFLKYAAANPTVRHTEDGYLPANLDPIVCFSHYHRKNYEVYNDKWAPNQKPSGTNLDKPRERLLNKIVSKHIETTGIEEEENIPCDYLFVDEMPEQHNAVNGFFSPAASPTSAEEAATPGESLEAIRKKGFGHTHRGIIMQDLHRLFGKMRFEFLHSRNARALGMLTNTDLVENGAVQFTETPEGKAAKEAYMKYKTEWGSRQEANLDPA